VGASGKARRAVLRVATRRSPLAQLQARRVAALLEGAGDVRCELVLVTTRGDDRPDVPVAVIGGQGAFVKEVQATVVEGRADVAVHSAKDLPSDTPAGLVLACTPERADPRDALVGARLDDLAPGALVATGSVRRRAQLAWLRPDLTFCELRGNMTTRLARAEATGAGVLALAALDRLGLGAHVTEVLDTGALLPQVGQGTLAVECRADDEDRRARLAAVDDAVVHACLDAERAFLEALGGGCTLPVGALATASAGGQTLSVEGLLASRDGRVVLRHRLDGARADAGALGGALARALLDERGGRSLEDWTDDAPAAPGAPGDDGAPASGLWVET
jgi:hydroxymethylbilane synthase